MKFSLNFKKKTSYTKIKDADKQSEDDILDEKKKHGGEGKLTGNDQSLNLETKFLLWKHYSIAYRTTAPHNLRYFRQWYLTDS